MTQPSPLFRWCARVEVDVGEPRDYGSAVAGTRRVVPIHGGRVSGEWTGQILPGGADWQTVRDDGSVLIDARYPVELEKVGTVVFQVRGVRDSQAEDPTFCTTLLIEGPDGTPLTSSVYVTVGQKASGAITYDLFEAQ